jgi:signal transduction histidine kinase
MPRLEALWKAVIRHPVVTLVALGAAAVGAVGYASWASARRLVERTALEHAALQSATLAEFRSLYTSEVVDPARRQGVEVTHDTRDKPHAIPLPVTMTILLGRKIGSHTSGAEAKLYSPYPFPWRAAEGGLRDAFARAAWEQLGRAPGKPFYSFETVGGRPALRYATADLMRARCVNCHNTHPDSPRTGWKEGDLRGVLEVQFPLDYAEAHAAAGLQGTTLVAGSLTLLGLGVVAAIIGRLRTTGLELERRVSELGAQEQELRSANERLLFARDRAQTADRAKSQFLARVSHELRTPLNAILGYAELIQDEAREAPPATLVADLQKIHDAGHSLLAMIDQLLRYVALDSGAVEVHVETFDVEELVAEVRGAVARTLEKNGNSFTLEEGPKMGPMRSDRDKVRSCLLNVLANAAKFTRGGAVTLRMGRRTEEGVAWIDFDVIDTGIGIAPERREELFKPFGQADPGGMGGYEGAGIGLALTRRFCRLLGGEVEILASEPGRGSSFRIRLPATFEGGPAS